ncbi:MAG: threonine--tRNA ligase [Phycisphaerae bacterium]|nr:threonine--tRNA ligase [Phycisphaerae bacterium]
MVTVRLPDGREVQHPDGVSLMQILQAIGPGLAKAAVAARVNGETRELFSTLSNTTVELQALKLDDPAALQMARHSTAHVMAEAICALWPQTKLVYGPPVEGGFYYDIDLDHKLTPEDFPRIEERMAAIVKEDRPFTRYEVPRDAGMKKLAAEGNDYKVDNALRAEGDVLSFYVTGTPNSGCWEDLCKGPHVPSTGRIGAFKILQVAGAYHHGDANKKQLQRVYGTTFPDKKLLQAHLDQIEEAKKRDHRKIGQELGLFTLDSMVGTGLVLWKPRGAVIRYTLENFIRGELVRRGYQPVYTPHIGRLELYRTSGHFPYYKDSQYPPIFDNDTARFLNDLWEATIERKDAAGFNAAEQRALARLDDIDPDIRTTLKTRGFSDDGGKADRNQNAIRTMLAESDGYLLKPMNCPMHMRIYGSEPRSYRDLPIRLAEFGTVYRYEQSGEVNGLTRVRGFTQDDAHLFCTPEQVEQEMADCVDLTRLVLKTLGMNDYRVRIGLRGDGDKYIGAREDWDMAEEAVRRAVRKADMSATEAAGEAAFYGPKIDFIVKDCIGRDWQLGTVQIDYNNPKRFNLRYIGDDNAEHRPVMIHRAPFGSLERFCGILIEHFEGAFPTWLAPVQAAVCSVSEKSEAYARDVFALCQQAGLRVELDASSERIGAKIRRATLEKTPYVLVIGEQEVAGRSVNVRTRSGAQLGNFTIPEFLHAVAQEIAERRLTLLATASGAAPG